MGSVNLSILSYVEVTLNRRFDSVDSQLTDVWVDKDRIYLLNRKWDHGVVGSARYRTEHNKLEVIDV
jgi:hypothetical protein